MHRFEVTPASSTGNADIDDQLHILFDMANEILFDSALDEDHAKFQHEVGLLFSYLEFHFASEELAMLDQSYDSRRFHAAFHDHVRREARSISAKLAEQSSIEEARDAIFFMLEDWVVYHVADADRQLATYLAESTPAGSDFRLPGIRPLKACGSIPADFDERAVFEVVGHS
jgi:hemerythrin-like metal-binding protein